MTTVEPIRSKKDLQKSRKSFKRKGRRDLLLFKIGINCGLRISDILSLNVRDVKNKEYMEIVEQKTKKRKIPINLILRETIRNYVKHKNSDEPLFVSILNKNRLDRITAYRIIKQAFMEAGIDGHFGTHTLRKTFGYHYYPRYKDIVMLQKILNHSHPSITLRYIGFEQEKIYKSYIDFIL